MKEFRALLVTVLFLAGCSLAIAQQAIKNNYSYVCDKEKIVIGHCRSDSDTLGTPSTKASDDYCQVYYPDRPRTGGFEAMAVVLRSDVVQTLTKCGALTAASIESSGTGSGPLSAQDYYDLGEEQYKAKKYAEAAESFKKVIAMDPASSPWVNLGNCYAQLGRYLDAVEAEKQGLKLKTDNAVAMYNIGLYYIGAKQFEDAVPWLVDFRKREPKMLDAASQLGYAYFSLDKYPESIAQFEDAIKLDPRDVNDRFNLAIVYASSGHTDLAMEQYKIVKPLDPDRAAKLLAKISGAK